MAENKNLFIKSKMNKDLDDRLVPNGEYRNAINIMISRSESQDVGAVETVLGNNIIQNSVIANVDNLSVIGVGKDESKNRIFLFLTNYNDNSDNALDNINTNVGDHYITMFNTVTEQYSILVTGGFLNFSKSSPVLGVNAVEDYLFFTDNRNQPRKINVERALASIDPVTGLPNHYTTEDNVSIVKYYPFDPVKLWEFDTTAGSVQANMKAKSIEYNAYNRTQAPDANPNPTYDANYAGDPDFMRDKFIRFSYRFKFEDNEYSLMAPFSQIAFIPLQDGFFAASSEDGWIARDFNSDEEETYISTINSLMENKVDSVDIIIPLPTTLNNIVDQYKIKEIEILYKESDNTNIKLIEAIEPDTTSTDNFIKYSYLAKKSVKILPEDQLTRVSDQAPLRAKAQEVIGNRVLYGNFLNRYKYPNTIDYKVGISEKFATNNTISPSNPLAEVARVEYPNHTLKRNRTYQVGIVLSDRYGRQSPVILNGEVTSETIGGVEYGSSTIHHKYGGDPNGTPPEYGPWPGTSVLNWTGDSIKLLFNNKIEVPGLPNKGLYDPIKNPLGWYSYKVVVQQTEQEYYNVYLPGILNGYPNTEFQNDVPSYIPTRGYDNKTAHIVLIGDNINKVPRDLVEVGPDQKKFRSSVNLYGRVVNVPSTTFGTFGQPGTSYDSTFNAQYYPAASFNAVSTTSYSNKEYHIAAEIGTFSDLGLGNTLGVFGTVAEGSPVQSLPGGIVGNSGGAKLYLTEYNPSIEVGMFVKTVDPISPPPTAPNVSIDEVNAIVISNVENPDYDPTGTTFEEVAKGLVQVQYYGNAAWVGSVELENNQRLFFSHTQMYDIDSNPLIARIETKRPIGTSIIQANAKNAPIKPYLAVYETEPTLSNLDIFYETTTSGLISDLNTAVDVGLTVADNITWSYNHLESYAIGTSVAGTISPTGPGGTPIADQEVALISATSLAANGTTVISRFNDFDFVTITPAGGGAIGQYELRTNNYFNFNYDALNNQIENYTFTFEITDLSGTNPVQTIVKSGSLSNVDPIITASLPNRIQLSVDPNTGGDVVTLGGRNGSFDIGANTDRLNDLVWELAYQYNEADILQTPIDNFSLSTTNTAGTSTLPSHQKFLLYGSNSTVTNQLQPGNSYVIGIYLYDASDVNNLNVNDRTLYNVIVDILNPQSNLNLPNTDTYRYWEGGTIFLGDAEYAIADGEGSAQMDSIMKPPGNHPAFATGSNRNNTDAPNGGVMDKAGQLAKVPNRNTWNLIDWDYLRGWSAFPGNKHISAGGSQAVWSPPIQLMGNLQDVVRSGSSTTNSNDYIQDGNYYVPRFTTVYGAFQITTSNKWNDNKPSNNYPDPATFDYNWGYGVNSGWQYTNAPFAYGNLKWIKDPILNDGDKTRFIPRGFFFVNNSKVSTATPSSGALAITRGFVAITFKMNMYAWNNRSIIPSNPSYSDSAKVAFYQSHYPQLRQDRFTNWADISEYLRKDSFDGAQWDWVGPGLTNDGKWNYKSVLYKNEEMSINGSSFDTQYNFRSGQKYNDYYRGDNFYFYGDNGYALTSSNRNKYDKIRRTLRRGIGSNLESFIVTGKTKGTASGFGTNFNNNYTVYPWDGVNSVKFQTSYAFEDFNRNQNYGRTIEDTSSSGSVKLNKFMALKVTEGWPAVSDSTSAYCEKTIVLGEDSQGELRIISGNLRRSLREVDDTNWDSYIETGKYMTTDKAESENIASKTWSTNINNDNPLVALQNLQAEEQSTSNIVMKDFFYSQEDPLNPGTYFTFYEYAAYNQWFTDPAAIYDPDNLGNASNGFNNGNYGFTPPSPIGTGGGFGIGWIRVYAKEPCFGYVTKFYTRTWNGSTWDFFDWSPPGAPGQGYVLYTQPFAAYNWSIQSEDSIPTTTGLPALSTDSNPSPGTGNRSVGYPFGTNCAFGAKKRDFATGNIVAGAGVWPYWHAFINNQNNVVYNPNGGAVLDLDTNGTKKQMPHPFAVKMNIS